jgi:hypothetical protein
MRHLCKELASRIEARDFGPKDFFALRSAIIMKLLAKTAEERYQTTTGVESDLLRCVAEWETQRWVDQFPLGEHDTPDRLLIPEKLYGRADEIGILLASFDRVMTSGRPELVLVSGYSGIGKSSVVNELHQVLVPPRGLFASVGFALWPRRRRRRRTGWTSTKR